MADTTKQRDDFSATIAAATFKDIGAALAQGGKAAIELMESFALDTQKQWGAAAETYVKFWAQWARNAFDLSAKTWAVETDTAQKAVDSLRRQEPA
jgi:hypothetical protein